MLALVRQIDELKQKFDEREVELGKIKEDFFYQMLDTMPFYNPKDLRSQMEDKLRITCSVDFNFILGLDALAAFF